MNKKILSIFGTGLLAFWTTGVAQAKPVYDGTNPPPLAGTVGDYYSYTLGTYMYGGTDSGFARFPPHDLYTRPSPKGIAGAANELDWHWIQGKPVYDLNFSSEVVLVFPCGDHKPYPQENVEALVLGSNNLNDPWVEASLHKVYRDGWIDFNKDDDGSIEADDWATEWIFPDQQAYRYILLDQTLYGPDNDMEIDAVGAPSVPIPASIFLFAGGLAGLACPRFKKYRRSR
jgi:hypothetical protein